MVLKAPFSEGRETALFSQVDWSRTKAYALGFNSLYINVRGREGQGTVALVDRAALAAEIAARLESLRDERMARKVVSRVCRREDVYAGPYVEDAPDLVVCFNPGYRMAWQTAIGGLDRLTLSPNTGKWVGDHLVDPAAVPGVLFANVRLPKDHASLLDIAPTILDALGIGKPAEMDGVSLF